MKKSVKLFAVIMILAMLAAPAGTTAVHAGSSPYPVEISQGNFPDPLFRNFILTGSHTIWDEDNNEILVVYDADNDGFLSESEAMNIKQLLVPERMIRDLAGVEYLPALIEIDCQRSSVQKMDLSKNTELIILNCYKANLQGKLDLSKNTKLEGASCHNNKDLTAIDISGCKELVSLSCDNTAVTELDFSNNPKFKSLSCAATDISKLDFSNNPELTIVSAYNTQISSFDASANKKLETLDLSLSKLTSLDVSGNTALIELFIDENPLAWLNVGNNPKLKAIISDSTISLEVPEAAFDITKEIPGIDPAKVSIVSGAKLNGTTVSGYDFDTPIVYNYDCGISSEGNLTLNVTVNLTEEKSGTVVPDTDKPSVQDKTPASPATGDDFPLTACAVILVLAGIVLAATVIRRKN